METLSTINVTGPDAFDFLQAQLTNDLSLLESESRDPDGLVQSQGPGDLGRYGAPDR